jgi:excisionase family DNA binding protein
MENQKMKNTNKIYAVSEVAKKLNITRQGVQWLITHGKLKAQKISSYYIIQDRDFQAYLKSKKK